MITSLTQTPHSVFFPTDSFCIGRTPTNTLTSVPFYNNPLEPYCTGYYTCINGVFGQATCPNNGFLDYDQYQCVANRPADQSCRVGKDTDFDKEFVIHFHVANSIIKHMQFFV